MSLEKERAEVRARIMHLIQTEGLEACVTGAIMLCKDERAPAHARASAISSLMRANGLFATQSGESPKELSEMTAAELKAAGDAIERERDAFLALLAAGAEDSGDVFE